MSSDGKIEKLLYTDSVCAMMASGVRVWVGPGPLTASKTALEDASIEWSAALERASAAGHLLYVQTTGGSLSGSLALDSAHTQTPGGSGSSPFNASSMPLHIHLSPNCELLLAHALRRFLQSLGWDRFAFLFQSDATLACLQVLSSLYHSFSTHSHWPFM